MQISRCRRHLLAVLTTGLALAAASVANSQPRVESPSDFQRTMDDPPPTDGSEYEADAAQAQARALQRNEPTPGLGPRAAPRIEEIVVQARKRAELLENTPVAVTVLSDELLRQAGIVQTTEIKDLVPNMTIAPGSQGMAPLLRIRGIGTSTIETAFDPGVGFYVDGVFLPRALGQVLDTVDIAQIEVLRGPQGTLFGKNTVGGAVSVTTAKPTDDYAGFVMLRPGNFGSLVTRAMVNLPIYEDKILTRLAISSRTSSGYVQNVHRAEAMSRDGSLNFLGTLRMLPVESLTIDVSGQYSQDQNNGRGGECVFTQEGAASALAPGLQPACEAVSGPFVTTANVAELNRVTSRGAWGVVQYDLADLGYVEDVLLKSITSWRAQTIRQRADLDQTFDPAIQLSDAGGSPFDGAPMEQEQIQQELQFNGSFWDGRINFVTGFFSFWEDSLSPRTVTLTGPVVPQIVTANRITTDNFTWALYGQATADFTDWLSLTAGLRYTSDQKAFTQETSDPRLDNPPFSGSDHATFASWTPAATVALLTPDEWLADVPVDHLMGYFSYSQGFKGGGFNAIAQSQVGSITPDPFGPETLDNFELGVKSIAFDQLLTINLALFYGDYTDIQVTQTETSVDPEGQITSRRVTQNAASASTKGVEVEVFARPLDGLQIAANLGYLDAKYDDFPNAENQFTGEIINRGGEPFRGVSPFQSFLSVQHSFPVAISDGSSINGWLTPRIEWAYRAGYNASWAEILPAHQRGYNLLNARLSYDFFDDRAQVAVWAKNLLDEAYFDTFQSVSAFGIVGRFYDPPRTFGGELSYSF